MKAAPDSSETSNRSRWGQAPWTIDFHPAARVLPEGIDFAIIGGGFTGLAAAAWLRRLAPRKSVALLESEGIGSGSSGRTGGMALAESSAGDLPALGDVLGGLRIALEEFAVECDLRLPGAYEVGRKNPRPISPIDWKDSGNLRVEQEVPGGTLDAGKLIAGLARAADRLGAQLFEHAAVEKIEFTDPLRVHVRGRHMRAHHVLIATNAFPIAGNDFAERAQTKFTLAVATEPLADAQLEMLGLASGKPFYTIDLPYLWGRLLASRGMIFGGGLVPVKNAREFAAFDAGGKDAAELFARLETRIRHLHPALRGVKFTHRWGGPILIAEAWRPVFSTHPHSAEALILGAYAGHGVALSIHLGRWAAEALLGRRELPGWNSA